MAAAAVERLPVAGLAGAEDQPVNKYAQAAAGMRRWKDEEG